MTKLTQTQVQQLLNYCKHCEGEGWYYGNLQHFTDRHNAIVKWLSEQVK